MGPYVMGRDPEAWPDAEKFVPQRWIPFKQPSLFELPIFQAGPRVCLGMQMALFEVKITTVLLLQHYTLELVNPKQSWQYNLGPTICVQGGLHVTAHRRREDHMEQSSTPLTPESKIAARD